MRTALPLLPVQRTWEPVIDQHETWLAVNPVQGCNKGCSYCYLLDRGQTRVKPAELATPRRTVDLLLANPYYHPGTALALYTCTDALSTPRTRAHLIGLLGELASRDVHNPVCLITKCSVTDDVVDAILAAQSAYIRVIVYLSYSGLGPDVEHGIDHEALRANFPACTSGASPSSTTGVRSHPRTPHRPPSPASWTGPPAMPPAPSPSASRSSAVRGAK